MAKRKGARHQGEPRVIGAAEAAEILGVRQPNLRTVRALPEPYDKIRATTLYREDDVVRVAQLRDGVEVVQARLQAMEAAAAAAAA